MLLRTLVISSALPLTFLVVGCEGEPEAEITGPSASSVADPGDAEDPVDPEMVPGIEPSTPPPGQSEPDTETVGDSRAINVELVEPSELQALIAQQKGKVVLVDFWATWCVPCVQQFPHTVELSTKYPDDLVVFAVSMNSADEEALVDVREFYAKQGPGNVRPLASADGDSDEAYVGFEITEQALPHYKVYGRDGQLIEAFGGDPNNPLDPDQIDAAIVEAIGQ